MSILNGWNRCLAFGLLWVTALSYSYTVAAANPRVSVLTYNIWGLGTDANHRGAFYEFSISNDIDSRVAKICEILKNGPWDIVSLQEVWRVRDRKFLKNCGYEYSVDNDAVRFLGLPDSGLMILSRYPVQYYERLPFQKNGSWRNLQDGEIFVYKSALYAVVDHPQIGPITVSNVHTVSSFSHASYSEERRDQIVASTKRALEIASEWSANRLIFSGDLNVSRIPWQADYEPYADSLLTELLPSFVSLDKQRDVCTSCASNPWNHDEGGGKIDEIFASPQFEIVDQDGGVVFNNKHIDYHVLVEVDHVYGLYPLSDHYGFETTFELVQ